MKQLIGKDHIPANKFTLGLSPTIGIPLIEFTEVSGLESEIETAELPDKTAVSGGRTTSGEFTAKVMMHNLKEVSALIRWWKDSQDPVRPDYKRQGILTYRSLTNRIFIPFWIQGMFPKTITLPDATLEEVTPQQLEVTFVFDEIEFFPAGFGVSIGTAIAGQIIA